MSKKNTENKNNAIGAGEILMVLEKMRSDFAVVSEHQSGQIESLSDRMDKRFEQVEQRFEQVEQRFEQVEQRFEVIDKRNTEADERAKIAFEYLSRVEDEVVELGKKENENEKDIDILQSKVMELIT